MIARATFDLRLPTGGIDAGYGNGGAQQTAVCSHG
jgi:hypothetical protein